jgi:uncharacterized membrane protein YidH (DUF202 family)
VPEIADSAHRWPYTVVGFAFAVYGIALIAYGTTRAREVDEAVARGEFARGHDRVLAMLTIAGVALGLATMTLIAIE